MIQHIIFQLFGKIFFGGLAENRSVIWLKIVRLFGLNLFGCLAVFPATRRRIRESKGSVRRWDAAASPSKGREHLCDVPIDHDGTGGDLAWSIGASQIDTAV